MAAVDATYGGARAKRTREAKAGKAKRQKLLVGGGALLLVLLLAVQVPRTLRMLGPAETAPAVPVEAAPAVPAPAPPPAAPGRSATADAQVQALLSKYTAKDPFARRTVGAPASAGVPLRPAPAGARDPFAARQVGTTEGVTLVAAPAGERDPFTPMVVASAPAPAPATPAPPAPTPPALPPAPPVAPPAPKPAVAPSRSYTIVLVSIPTRSGRAAAARAAVQARARGLTEVGVLRSGDYRTLRHGYWVVHMREFATLSDAQRAIWRARAAGYRNAYVRPLGR